MTASDKHTFGRRSLGCMSSGGVIFTKTLLWAVRGDRLKLST